MIVLIAREPKPDAPYWPGRRLLAAIDAVAWPFVLVLLLARVPAAGGLMRLAVVVVATLCAAFRLYSAVLVNHRYRFTTWWCARLVALLLFVGVVMKLSLPG